MNTFYLEYRDPLFSIIIFFIIIFFIAFFSYWWGKYQNKENSKYLDDFLKQFNVLPSKDELKILIQRGDISEKSWLLLASSYYKSGDFEKSIEIYNEILSLGNSENSKETMFLLGKTYLRAGFLERSKQIFLKILKVNPRTPQALRYLLLVYEYMRDYKSALDVLEPLEELKNDILLDRVYLNSISIVHQPNITEFEKVDKLLEIYTENHMLDYFIFDYAFRVNPKKAWSYFDASKTNLLIDVLWRLESEDLNSDIISSNGYLRELFTARGDFILAESSSVLEFDILIKLNGKSNTTLCFEYVCDNCKQVYPFTFSRCGGCHSIDTVRVDISLCRDYNKDFCEENNSFQ